MLARCAHLRRADVDHHGPRPTTPRLVINAAPPTVLTVLIIDNEIGAAAARRSSVDSEKDAEPEFDHWFDHWSNTADSEEDAETQVGNSNLSGLEGGV